MSQVKVITPAYLITESGLQNSERVCLHIAYSAYRRQTDRQTTDDIRWQQPNRCLATVG